MWKPCGSKFKSCCINALCVCVCVQHNALMLLIIVLFFFLILSCRHEYSMISFMLQHAVAAFCYMVYFKRRLSDCNNQLSATMKSIRKRYPRMCTSLCVYEWDRGMSWEKRSNSLPIFVVRKVSTKKEFWADELALDKTLNNELLQYLTKRSSEQNIRYHVHIMHILRPGWKIIKTYQCGLAWIFLVENLKTPLSF